MVFFLSVCILFTNSEFSDAKGKDFIEKFSSAKQFHELWETSDGIFQCHDKICTKMKKSNFRVNPFPPSIEYPDLKELQFWVHSVCTDDGCCRGKFLFLCGIGQGSGDYFS